MRYTLRSKQKDVRRCRAFSLKLDRGQTGSLRPVTPTRDREMTFKHKLSKRLAILWSTAAVSAAFVWFACAGGDRVIAPDQPSASTGPNTKGITVAPIAPSVGIQDITKPGTVADLAVAGATDSSVTLSFIEVNDGNGSPASYAVRFAVGSIAWGSATDVKSGSCAVPMQGGTIGAKRSCQVRGLAPSTGYQFQLVPFSGTLDVDAVFGALSNVVSATTPARGTTTKPGSVTDLAVAVVSDTSATLSFTEVSDGSGSPPRYDVRFAKAPLAWGSASSVSRGSCTVPLMGQTISGKLTCQVQGLSVSTNYQFQLVAYRGTLNVDATFGNLSNVASGTTTAKPTPVKSVTVTPATA